MVVGTAVVVSGSAEDVVPRPAEVVVSGSSEVEVSRTSEVVVVLAPTASVVVVVVATASGSAVVGVLVVWRGVVVVFVVWRGEAVRVAWKGVVVLVVSGGFCEPTPPMRRAARSRRAPARSIADACPRSPGTHQFNLPAAARARHPSKQEALPHSKNPAPACQPSAPNPRSLIPEMQAVVGDGFPLRIFKPRELMVVDQSAASPSSSLGLPPLP